MATMNMAARAGYGGDALTSYIIALRMRTKKVHDRPSGRAVISAEMGGGGEP